MVTVADTDQFLLSARRWSWLYCWGVRLMLKRLRPFWVGRWAWWLRIVSEWRLRAVRTRSGRWMPQVLVRVKVSGGRLRA